MKQRAILLFVLSIFFLFTTRSFALINGELLIGEKNAKFSTSSYSSTVWATQFKIAGHVDPIPLVPVAFGLFYVNETYDVDGKSSAVPFDSFMGNEFGGEVVAWLPFDLLDNISLYGRLGYVVWGPHTGKIKSGFKNPVTGETEQYSRTVTYNETGALLAVGLKWHPLPLVSGLLELDFSNSTYERKDVKVNGEKASKVGFSNLQNQSTAVLIGAQVGI